MAILFYFRHEFNTELEKLQIGGFSGFPLKTPLGGSYLDLLAGGVDVPADLGQAVLGLGQQVQLGLVHLVGQTGDLAVLLSHQQVPLDQMLGFTVLQIFNFL